MAAPPALFSPDLKRAFVLDVRIYCGTKIALLSFAIVEAGPNSGFGLHGDTETGPRRWPGISIKARRVGPGWMRDDTDDLTSISDDTITTISDHHILKPSNTAITITDENSVRRLG